MINIGEVSAVRKDKSSVFVSSGKNSGVNAASFKMFKNLLGTIAPGMSVHFATGAQWSMHQLLIYLLTLTGPVDVYMSTWAITESPIREMLAAMQDGLIKTMNCVFDYRIKERNHKALLMAQESFTRIKLTKCHAKVTVLRNDDFGIVVNGSANYTRNPRIEAGVITHDAAIADFHIDWIKRELDGDKVFGVRSIDG